MRRPGAAGVFVVSLALALVVDATVVEPYAVEVTRATVPLAVRDPLVVVQLSDLHTHGFGRRERQVAALVAAVRPDVIAVTGDVVDEGSLEPVRELFAHLSARLGVWVVRGNWEHWRAPPNERAFWASVGAHLLVNEGVGVREDVWIAGLDDSTGGTPDVDAALRGAPSGVVRLALFHSPDLFDAVAPKVDLALAGHTHGGQVSLPLLGPPWLPPGSGAYVDGWYQRGAARMHVSRGVGTSILPVRFLCRPEVAVVELIPSATSGAAR